MDASLPVYDLPNVSAKAAKIYLTLLEQRRLPIAGIARASGLKRASCYEHIDELLSREYILREPVGRRMMYRAQSPQKVAVLVEKHASKTAENLRKLQERYDTAANKPRVTYLEGKQAIRSLYEESFKTVGESRSIFPPATFFEHFTFEEFDAFDREINAHSIVTKDLILTDEFTKRVLDLKTKNNNGPHYNKRLPKDFTSNVDLLIYGDSVALVSLRDLTAVVIENHDIAHLLRSMHESIWRHA